ncbi:hypothetical protein ACIHFC_35250 [Streptomyces sp. NPDC052013]|uniref:hypothetical protein n=1 Tax=Streptomyces sp. NPDC052013 TaxID=3365679 RepID=UPI0037D01480
MNTDDALSQALRQAASQVPVGPPPVAAIIRQGRSLRRRRRSVGLAVAVAFLAPACFLTVRSAATPPITPASTASASTTAQMVTSGERVTTPSGTSLWLTRQGLFLVAAGHPASAPDTFLVTDTPAGHVGGLARGSNSGTVWAGVYRGPGAPSKITIAVRGQTFQARIYTLPGSPGWLAYYTETSKHLSFDSPKPTVRAYAADGTLLMTTRL